MGICKICGKEFSPSLVLRDFCSFACQDEGKQRRYMHKLEQARLQRKERAPTILHKECIVCGKKFETLLAIRICCSDACAAQRERERMRANRRRASDAKRVEKEVMQEACEACVPHKRQAWEDKSPMDYG